MISKKIEWVLVILVLVIVTTAIIKTNEINVIGPRGSISNQYPLFSWTGNFDQFHLLVDDNNQFENPLINVTLEENSFRSKQLDSGKYYWKVVGFKENRKVETGIIKFILDSVVSFSLDGDTLINTGNVKSRLSTPTGFVVLNPNQRIKTEDENYTLEQE